jgi:hypothetical protein
MIITLLCQVNSSPHFPGEVNAELIVQQVFSLLVKNLKSEHGGVCVWPEGHLHEDARKYMINVKVGYFESLNNGRVESIILEWKVIEKDHSTECLWEIETGLSHLVKERHSLIDVLLSVGDMNVSF